MKFCRPALLDAARFSLCAMAGAGPSWLLCFFAIEGFCLVKLLDMTKKRNNAISSLFGAWRKTASFNAAIRSRLIASGQSCKSGFGIGYGRQEIVSDRRIA
jgi:hypothetical protein